MIEEMRMHLFVRPLLVVSCVPFFVTKIKVSQKVFKGLQKVCNSTNSGKGGVNAPRHWPEEGSFLLPGALRGEVARAEVTQAP